MNNKRKKTGISARLSPCGVVLLSFVIIRLGFAPNITKTPQFVLLAIDIISFVPCPVSLD